VELGIAFTALSESEEIPKGVDLIHAPPAWQHARGRDIRVALLDTGVYPDHEDLTVRDYLSFCADDADPADKNGHGTNLAGLICSPRNGKGIIGVAPECSLSSAKVLNSSGSGTFEDILRALNWCSNSRVDVVVMSFGVANGTNANIEAKLNQMEESGVIVVTGPRAIDGRPIFPGVCNSVIAVAPPSSQFQSYSGDVICWSGYMKTTGLHDGYEYVSGSSLSVPLVAGVVALVKSLRKGMKTRQMRELLIATSEAAPDIHPIRMVHALKAVEGAL
jgi:subtilisin family serine protease